MSDVYSISREVNSIVDRSPAETLRKPDIGLAKRHVELLTGYAEAPCCFRLFPDETAARRDGEACNLAGTLDDVWPKIEELQREGWGGYIVINEGGQNARAITRVRALFIDVDGKPTPTTWHAKPDFIVRRDAAHWHAYWLVGGGFPLEEFKPAQKRLIAHYGTDPLVHDLPRVMRLAGTLHLKDPSSPRLITIEGDAGSSIYEVRSKTELLAGLPAEISEAENRTRHEAINDKLNQPHQIARAKEYLAKIFAEQGPWGQDDEPDTYLIGQRVKDIGVSEEWAVDLLMEHLAGDELEWITQTVSNIYKYGQNEPGCGEPGSPERKYGDPDAFGDAKPAAEETDDNRNTTAAEPDDGGPKVLNLDSLDDAHVGGDWTTYTGEMAEQPPLVAIIPNWAEKGVITYEDGPGGVGKSYIAEQEAACVNAGYPIWGEPVEQTDVLYLNYEEPQAEFDRRLYRIKNHLGQWLPPANVSAEQWEQMRIRGEWRQSGEFHPLDTSRFSARHLRGEAGGHLLRVRQNGDIRITRFGRQFLEMLARRSDAGKHSYIVFDGLIDAILFEGSTRSQDDVARQVIALLDQWCTEYAFTGRAIIHPSRTGERTGTESYAPAWTTKPRGVNSYRRMTFDGKPVTDYLPEGQIFTRRTASKRNHTVRCYIDLQYRHGLFQRYGASVIQEPIDAAVEIALRYADGGERIKRDGQVGKDGPKLFNQHQIISEYRKRTASKHGADHFLGSLDTAFKAGRIGYEASQKHTLAGYTRLETPVDVDKLNYD